MSEKLKSPVQPETVQSVTSVGNSWIICRSKSHAGRIYYFNTLSGEAAWNLSPQEIEKAKTRTKFFESQSGGNFESCPEPKDPPVDSIHSSRSQQTSQIFIPSRVYNKQIINNQFSKQPLPPVVSTQCSKCSSLTSIDSMGVNLHGPHNCNPNVWAIPPHHQIVIAPTASPILDQLQTSINSPYNKLEQRVSVQNTALPLTFRFNQMQRNNRSSRFANGIKKRNNNNAFQQKYSVSPYHNKNKRFPNSMDLRQKLTARRKSNNVFNNVTENVEREAENVNKNECTQKIQIIKPVIAEKASSIADDQWLKENASAQGSQLLLDVTPLKQLVTAGSSSTWYIVADISVLLNHINLMQVIVNSDEKCQLMVPDFVMTELQTQSIAPDSQLLNRAHYILQILSRQFTLGNAVLGKDPTSDTNIHDFCYKMAAQDHDVVLITNNMQWKSYQINSIFTLSVNELKDMLSNAAKPTERSLRDANIQITIPNDSIKEDVMDNTDSNTMSVGIQSDFDDKECSETETNSSCHFNKKQDFTLRSKHTIDIGTQTDLQPSNKMNFSAVNTETRHIEQINGINDELHTCNKDVSASVEMPKRREIRLKRHVPHQPDTVNNAEKKQYKWRRKRNASMSYTNATDQKIAGNNSEDKTKSNIGAESCRHDNSFDHECKSASNDPASSETSSSYFIQKSLDGKVIVEETSTSGVISNSADSESVHSMKHSEQNYTNINSDACKCVMFEVESPEMEEYLKMRSDEWVSRFVQIMEEVLTQILQQTPAFYNRSLPPPWTIHEATECIKKKFENDSDVKDAAIGLGNVLFKISDGRGKISVDLTPCDFMEMYSYGVYLVDALQSVLSNCEDLQTAADSLSKLLGDIQDPGHDTSHTDAFTDGMHLPPAEVTETTIGADQASSAIDDNTPKRAERSPNLKSPSSNGKEGRRYNLRSSQKKLTQDEPQTEQPVKFIRKIDIESNFFSSLNLQKNPTIEENTNANNCASGVVDSLSTSKQDKISENLDKEVFNNTEAQKTEPKIIRNFKKCLEFEQKLMSTQKETLEEDKKSLSMNDTENFDDDYGYDDYDDYTYDYDYNGIEEFDDTETYNDSKEEEAHVIDERAVDKVVDFNFKTLIHTLVNEIQATFLEVKSFCAKITKELVASKTLNSQITPARKSEIKTKAELARLHIDGMMKSLNSILTREAENPENKIHRILEESSIRVDFSQSVEYRKIIEQYPKQANILLDTVNLLLDAVN